MAAASSFVECGFCLKRNEELKEPKRLPCGHIHCSSCLQGSLEAKTIVECPHCKEVLREQIHELPNADLGHQSVQSDCDACKEKEPAVLYCTDNACKLKFCLNHAEFHARGYRTHHTITIEEFHRYSRKHERKVCSCHEDQLLKFGCRRCPKILCEDCLGEPDSCYGSHHQTIKLVTIFNELKQNITKVRDKVEKRKDELSAIAKKTDQALAQYGEETGEMVKLLRKTRDEQLAVINSKYTELESKLSEGRKVAEEEMVKFKESVVEAERSQLKTCLEEVLAGFDQDHIVDVVTRGKTPSRNLEAMTEEELPSLHLTKRVALVTKRGAEKLNAETTTTKIDVSIGANSDDESVEEFEDAVASIATDAADTNDDGDVKVEDADAEGHPTEPHTTEPHPTEPEPTGRQKTSFWSSFSRKN